MNNLVMIHCLSYSEQNNNFSDFDTIIFTDVSIKVKKKKKKIEIKINKNNVK